MRSLVAFVLLIVGVAAQQPNINLPETVTPGQPIPGIPGLNSNVINNPPAVGGVPLPPGNVPAPAVGLPGQPPVQQQGLNKRNDESVDNHAFPPVPPQGLSGAPFGSNPPFGFSFPPGFSPPPFSGPPRLSKRSAVAAVSTGTVDVTTSVAPKVKRSLFGDDDSASSTTVISSRAKRSAVDISSTPVVSRVKRGLFGGSSDEATVPSIVPSVPTVSGR
ncbi:hypothetical protein M3Y98_01125000 [Aphelenchoides besseyi]|nr:hypothetical protein M3Y98_01125000 [Aphelenchoides besseyi]KAI6210529.1 hypothetical protein M3Y96_00337900 [Aphelenchoides besseyi]